MSLRVRLLAAVGAVALVALLIASVATYSSLRSFLYERVDQTLTTVDDALTRRGPRPGPETFAALSSGVYAERRDAAGEVVELRPGVRDDGTQFTPDLPDAAGLSEEQTSRTFTSGGYRVRASYLPDGSQLLLALPLDDARATLRRLLVVEAIVALGALGAASALGWWLVQVGLKPLAEVEATAGAIAEGDLDRRVPGDDAPTEVGSLARALNTMLERIQEAFAQRDATEARLRQFVADASHELRTPLAAVSAYAEVFERGADSRPEDLSRVMSGIRTETKRMGDLVQDLLLLARLDEGRPLERKPVELVGLAAEAVGAATAVGPEWPVRIDASAPVEVTADRTQLRQVVDNLLANVRAHTPAGTEAVVAISAEDGDAVVTVSDNGPGLDDEQAAKIFERFFRAEASRSRQHGGGSGLGLAIVAAIVGAHRGTVTVSTPPDGGAAFTVRLPQAAEESAEEIYASSQP